MQQTEHFEIGIGAIWSEMLRLQMNSYILQLSLEERERDREKERQKESM
jgi:hypothetical protein